MVQPHPNDKHLCKKCCFLCIFLSAHLVLLTFTHIRCLLSQSCGFWMVTLRSITSSKTASSGLPGITASTGVTGQTRGLPTTPFPCGPGGYSRGAEKQVRFLFDFGVSEKTRDVSTRQESPGFFVSRTGINRDSYGNKKSMKSLEVEFHLGDYPAKPSFSHAKHTRPHRWPPTRFFNGVLSRVKFHPPVVSPIDFLGHVFFFVAEKKKKTPSIY